MSSAFVDNSPKKKLERMADTITRLRNEISVEKNKDPTDVGKIRKLIGSLNATISNFEELYHKEDMTKRLKKLGGSRKGKKHTFKKNTRRNRRIRKTNKH
jgi:hypothetical protein